MLANSALTDFAITPKVSCSLSHLPTIAAIAENAFALSCVNRCFARHRAVFLFTNNKFVSLPQNKECIPMTSLTDMQAVLLRQNFVILDTETTGLKRPAEIVQIAILDFQGLPRLHTYVKPVRPIPFDAQRIHGITDEMVQDAPDWKQVRQTLLAEIQGKDVIVYNATYDRHMMHCSDEASGLGKLDYHSFATWNCAMLWYADVRSEWDSYHGNNRWHKLADACVYEHITVDAAHDALGDCKMTYQLLRQVQYRLDFPSDTGPYFPDAQGDQTE
jgi:DNA polymerase III subunit epsilon